MITRSGLKMPRLLYGSYNVRADTSGSIINAIQRFEGLDTTGEFAVGRTLSFMFTADWHRNLTFIQTKVNTNYAAELSPGAPVYEQVLRSIESTLKNLNVSYVDSLLLESHYIKHEQTMEAWRGMEEAVQKGYALQLGLANAEFDQVLSVDRDASVKPAVVQQAYVGDFFVEHDMREWCEESGVVFQTWAALGRHSQVIQALKPLAQKYNTTSPALFLRWAMGWGLMAISPTMTADQMEEDIAAPYLSFNQEDAGEVFDVLNTLAQ